MAQKLIAILVDGLSAKYVETYPQFVPNILALGRAGTVVNRLGSPIPATSMPGRASMVTGLPPERNGIYGNHLLRGAGFLPADPGDLRAPTIAAHAKNAGRQVACIGAGMIPHEEAHILIPPAWLRSFLDKSRFAKEVP